MNATTALKRLVDAVEALNLIQLRGWEWYGSVEYDRQIEAAKEDRLAALREAHSILDSN